MNVHNKEGYTPLNLATEKGLKEMVKVFLADQRIDVNKNNTGDGANAILIASKRGYVEILTLLLLHDQTFVNQQNSERQSALSIAIKKYEEGERKQLLAVKLILRCPKTKREMVKWRNGEIEPTFQREITQYLNWPSSNFEQNKTCCHKVNASLLDAAWVGDFRAIRGLLECPGSKSNANTFDKKGRTPLYIAAMRGHLKAVNILLQNQYVDVNIARGVKGATAFSIASENSHFDVKSALILNGKSVMSQGWCLDNWTKPCKQTSDFSSVTKNQTVQIPLREFLLKVDKEHKSLFKFKKSN